MLASLRFLTFAGAAVLFGIVPMVLLVLRPAMADLGSADRDEGRRRLVRRLGGVVDGCLAAVGFSAVATLVVLVGRAASLHAGGVQRNDVSSTIQTPFGVWTVLRILLVAGFLVALRGQVRSRLFADRSSYGGDRAYWLAWSAFGALILITVSASGHAAAGSWAVAAVVVNVAHVASASVWLTGVALLATVLPVALRGRRDRVQVRLLAPALVGFSRVAFAAVIVAALTGGLNALLTVGSFAGLRETDYGRALVVKLWLFLWILALGGLNHFVLLRRLTAAAQRGRRTPTQVDVALSVAGEFLFGVALLAVTAVLTGLAPPT